MADDGRLSAARLKQQALARLAKPIEQKRGPRYDIGDGDVCPVNPSHGHMLWLQHSRSQFCPDQSHDGRWSEGSHQLPTRAFWPQGWQSFAAAVTEWRASLVSTTGESGSSALPDIDLGGFDL